LARPLAAVVSALQGGALIINGVAVAAAVVAGGITGPADVASPVGVAVEALLFVGFGAALLLIGRALRLGDDWALTPFLLAQVLGLAVALPLASTSGAAGLVGVLVSASCLAGILAWVPLVRQRLRPTQ